MRYAKILNGVCENVAEFDNPEIAKLLGYTIELNEGFGIGDIFDGISWRKSADPTINDLVNHISCLEEFIVAMLVE